MKNTYLAVDFGGGSGRVMAGYIDGGKLILEEVHRFGNRQVKLGEHVYWDFPALFQDMKDGLKKAAQKDSIAEDMTAIGFLQTTCTIINNLISCDFDKNYFIHLPPLF